VEGADLKRARRPPTAHGFHRRFRGCYPGFLDASRRRAAASPAVFDLADLDPPGRLPTADHRASVVAIIRSPW
jgi:hypothetical protein